MLINCVQKYLTAKKINFMNKNIQMHIYRTLEEHVFAPIT
jgi:hypothetical protein